jgi:hypothetical protein
MMFCIFLPFFSVSTVYRDGSAYAKGLMPTGFYDGIVGDGQEAFVRKYFTIEICGIVLIASNKHHPVIIAVHPPAVSPDDIVVVAFVLKAKAAVPSDNQRGWSRRKCHHRLLSAWHQETGIAVCFYQSWRNTSQ